jgi:hypothetical protein
MQLYAIKCIKSIYFFNKYIQKKKKKLLILIQKTYILF